MRREMIAHLLGAAGVVCALLAILAVFDQAWEQVYAWLGFALILQAAGSHDAGILDHLNQGDHSEPELAVGYAPIPSIAGFLTTVFVPVVAMLHAGFLDGMAGAAVACIILMSALYRLAFLVQSGHFDTHVLGLPAAWSVIGFYLHAFDATPAAAVLTIGLGITLGLLPFNWPRPLNSVHWPVFTRLVVVVWFATAGYTLVQGFQAAGSFTKAILLGIALYGLALAAVLARNPGSSQPAED